MKASEQEFRHMHIGVTEVSIFKGRTKNVLSFDVLGTEAPVQFAVHLRGADVWRLAELLAEFVGGTVYHPAEDADSEIGPELEEAV